MNIRDVTQQIFTDRGADYIHFGHIERSELPNVLTKPEGFLKEIGAKVEADSQIQVQAVTRPRGSRPAPNNLIIIVVIWDGVIVIIILL